MAIASMTTSRRHKSHTAHVSHGQLVTAPFARVMLENERRHNCSKMPPPPKFADASSLQGAQFAGEQQSECPREIMLRLTIEPSCMDEVVNARCSPSHAALSHNRENCIAPQTHDYSCRA